MAPNHTFSVLSIIRKSRSKQHKVPIYIRINVSGKRSEISTKEYVDETKWNRTKGRVKGNSELARQINNHLDTWETKVREHYNQFIRDEKKKYNSSLIEELCIGKTRQEKHSLRIF
jgi:uridine kinase